MDKLQIFEHPKFGEIRTIVEGGKTLFCGKDAAEALQYKGPDKAIRTHCRWRVKRPVPHPQNPEKNMEMTFITEGDLCRLAAKSELPGANEFESWIFDEVIPAILRTGSYTVPGRQAAPRLNFPQGVSLSGLAKLISVTRCAMLDMGSTPVEIGAVIRGLYDSCGVPLDKAFSKQIPGQLCLFDRPALET